MLVSNNRDSIGTKQGFTQITIRGVWCAYATDLSKAIFTLCNLCFWNARYPLFL